MRYLAFALLVLAACGDSGGGPRASDAGDVQCGELTCHSNEVCHWESNNCGSFPNGTTRCLGRAVCTNDDPVCGCDGVIYPGECDAYAAGVDLDGNFHCPMAANHFQCGYTQCDITDQTCGVTDYGNGRKDYGCGLLPSQCTATRTCDCLLAVMEGACGRSCMGSSSTGFTVTCGNP